MSIKTKQIYEKASQDDGVRFLITRYYPRGVRKDQFDEWLRALSPSPKLLFDYKEKKITWETFKDRFVIELASNIESVDLINILHDEMKSDVITLLCYEKNGVACHRHIVAELIGNPKKLPNIEMMTEPLIKTKTAKEIMLVPLEVST